jgi:TRAP-type C4-dicarboxylate transport system permease small subunit
MRLLVNILVLIVLWLLVSQVGNVIAIESRSTSVSLPLPVPRAWFYSIPLMVCCLSMMATCAWLIAAELTVLAGARDLDTRRGLLGPPPAPVGGPASTVGFG